MKKFFIVFMLLCSVAFASDEENSFVYTIDTFEGGLNSHINDYVDQKNSCHDCRNVRFNEVYGGVSKRDELISFGNTGGTKVTGLYRYYQNDDTGTIIASEGTNVSYGSDNDGTFTVLRDGQSDGRRWTFTTYKDNLIGMNGYNVPLKWDGNTNATANTANHRTALNLCADLGAPYADLTTGTQLDASKWYQYKVLFYDGDGNYYYTNARSNPIKTGSTVHDIALSDIPLGDSTITSRQIYRTEGAADAATVEADTAFKLVTTLTDNTTTVYHDLSGDASLGGNLSITGHNNVTPPLGKYCHVNDERLFIAGNQDNKSHIYWSEQFKPDYFLSTEYEVIREDDGDEITFLKTLLGVLIIGKRNSIQKFHTDGGTTTNWQLSDPYTHEGCPAPYSVVNSAKGLIYLGRKGLYLFDGQYSSLISDNVTPQIRDINQAGIEDCFGIYYDNAYQLAYTSQESGSATNDRVLIYDLVRNSFSLDYKNINCMATLYAGDDYGSLYYGASTNGYIYEEGAAETSLKFRYKSDFDAGTLDDVRSFGVENDPTLSLAWDLTGNFSWSESGYTVAADMTGSGATRYLGAREDRDGSWISAVKRIDADALEKLYWNENLNGYGDIDFRVRTGATSAACSTASWGTTQHSDPSGSDISGDTANTFIQLIADLSTSNIVYAPELYREGSYVVRVVYDKSGSAYESSVNTYWESHWFEPIPRVRGLIKNIRIFYSRDEDSTGDITFNIKNIEGDIDTDFTLDLGKTSYTETSEGDKYFNVGDEMMFQYFPANDMMGNKWKLSFSETGIYQYTIKKIEVIVWAEELLDI